MTRAGRPQRRALLACAIAALLAVGCEGDRTGDGRESKRDAAAPPPPVTMLDAGMSDAQAPPAGQGAPAPLDGGRPLGMNPDALFGARQPRGPRSTARIAVRVLDTDHAPVAVAYATAGGAVAISAASGYVLVDDVYGETEADLSVTARGFTRYHVRVPIRAGETSYAVAVLARTTSTVIADLADDGGTTRDEALRLRFDAESFAQPWRAVASGQGTLLHAVLGEPVEAAAAPNSLLAVDGDGGRVRLSARGLFELRATTRGTQLELRRPVRFELQLSPAPVSAGDAGAADPALGLYWFDPDEFAFVRRGDVDEDEDGIARGEIDRMGFWAVGAFDEGARSACQRVRVQDESGAPVANAAVHVTHASLLDSAHLITGADGSACWELRPASVIRALVFGAAGGELITADVTDLPVAANDAPGACDDAPEACATPPAITAAPIALGCVRGTLEIPPGFPVNWFATPEDGARTSGNIARDADGAFCLTLPRTGELAFSGTGIDCGPPRSLPTRAGVCGLGTCPDLGVVRCCYNDEICTNGADDDCDDAVDEGCQCGGSACGAPLQSTDRCCTDTELCGSRSPYTGECVVPGQAGVDDPECASETVPVHGGDTITATGCCRLEGQCGLRSEFGCVLRADAASVWPLTESLAPSTCTL